MSKRAEALTNQNLQARNKLWWERNPMSYDWHRTMLMQEGTREFFEEMDRRFFGSSPFYLGERPFGRLIPFDHLSGKRVLEIGCGLGAHAQLLAEAGCDLTCIDLTQKAVDLTLKRFALRRMKVDVRMMNAEKMTFPDAEFDFVWSWGVIHHSPDTEAIVREVYRVLKEGGEFRLMVYHRRSLTAGVSLMRGLASGKFFKGMSVADVLNFYSDGYLARFYTRDQITDMLTRYGFRIVRTSVMGQKSELLPIPGKGLIRRLKSVVLSGTPDRIAGRLLAVVGSFLFATALKNPRQAS